MNRNEMIKWLSENTTREQWFSDVNPLFFKGVNEYPEYWGTHPVLFSDEYFVFNNETSEKITVDDVFEPVDEQPVYIDGGIYEIGVMNGEPQQFVYNLKLNMFERGSNESIGASNVHDSKVVTHFKLVSEPCSERVTVAKEIINNIRRGVNNEFTNSSAVTSEPQGLLNHRRDEVPIGKVISSEITDDRVNITMGLNPEHPLFKPLPEFDGVNLRYSEPDSPSVLDKQEGGSHYKGKGVQPWEVIKSNDMGFFDGNALKYLMRHKDKNGAEDIRKAIHYLEAILEFEYGECDGNVRR